jgi:protein-tyrosine phosphatase
MPNVTINSDKVFLFKQWKKHVFQLNLENGSIIMMPKPPGGLQLKAYVEFLKSLEVDCVVSLLQQPEIEQFSLTQEGVECREQNIAFINFPIQDHSIPQFFLPFNQLIEKLSLALNKNKIIAIHCYAGIGRTGITAASLLIKNGVQVDLALMDLSKTRGLRVPETLEQITWLHRYSEQLLGSFL